MNWQKKLVIFLFFNLLVWSVVPLLRQSLPMDTQEAIVWGKYCLWGTTKHPPLSGWIAYSFWTLFQHWDGAMYLLSQIFVALGVWYIYKLAREFVDEVKAVLAAMLQFGVIYYNFSTPEFNVNLIAVALWPMNAYYFWRAYCDDKWKDWLLFGAITALNLLNKYTASLLIFALGIFVITSSKRRKIFTNYKAYTAGLFCLLLLTPHIWWMYEHNFEPLNYIAFRNKDGKFTAWWRHLLYPAKFLLAQVLFAGAALLTYCGFYRTTDKEKSVLNAEQKKYLLLLLAVPVVTMAITGVFSGKPLKSMWAFPMLFPLGTVLIAMCPQKTDAGKTQKMFNTMVLWSCLFACGYGAQCLLTRSERFHSDCKQIVQTLESKWNNAAHGQPLEYIGSSEWYAHMVNLYGSHEIKPIVWVKPQSSPWFDADDFQQKGALIVANDLGEYHKYMEMLGQQVSEPQTLELEFKNYFGKTKNKEIFYGFYHLQGGKNAEE